MDRGNENAGATSGGSGEFPAAPMGGFAAMMNALKAETSGTGDPDAISLASATRLKDQGNAAYKRRDFAAAAGHYGKAARVVTAATDPALLALSRNPRAPSAALLRLRAALCCNRGALFLEVAKLGAKQLLREPLVRQQAASEGAFGDGGGSGSGGGGGGSPAEAGAEAGAEAVRAWVLRRAEAVLLDALDTESGTASLCPDGDDLQAKAKVRLERVRAALRELAAAAPAHFGEGQRLEDEGDYGGAEAEYRRAVGADVAYADAHAALGGLLMAVRADYAGAIGAYQRVRELAPSRTDVLANLCGMLSMRGDFSGAEEVAHSLVRLTPEDPEEGRACLERVLAEREKATDDMYANVM
jgi:tetratricopeptide (TPR) repeat protein